METTTAQQFKALEALAKAYWRLKTDLNLQKGIKNACKAKEVKPLSGLFTTLSN